MLSTLLNKYFYTLKNKPLQGMAPPVLHLKHTLNLNAHTKFSLKCTFSRALSQALCLKSAVLYLSNTLS